MLFGTALSQPCGASCPLTIAEVPLNAARDNSSMNHSHPNCRFSEVFCSRDNLLMFVCSLQAKLAPVREGRCVVANIVSKILLYPSILKALCFLRRSLLQLY